MLDLDLIFGDARPVAVLAPVDSGPSPAPAPPVAEVGIDTSSAPAVRFGPATVATATEPAAPATVAPADVPAEPMAADSAPGGESLDAAGWQEYTTADGRRGVVRVDAAGLADIDLPAPCDGCGGLDRWQDARGNWRCPVCDPAPAVGERLRTTAADIRRRHVFDRRINHQQTGCCGRGRTGFAGQRNAAPRQGGFPAETDRTGCDRTSAGGTT